MTKAEAVCKYSFGGFQKKGANYGRISFASCENSPAHY